MRVQRSIIAMAAIVAGTLTTAVCVAQLPVTSFETEAGMELFSPGGVTFERVQQHASDGEWAVRVRFPGSEQDTWPGFSFRPQVDLDKYQALAFDAYNPADEPVRLSWRLDLADGENQFGGTSIAPGASTIELWIAGLGEIERIYLYDRMPREDHEIFFDNFRWTTIENRFEPLIYVDQAEPPAPTDQEQQQGFILFGVPLTDVVFANRVPRAEERIGSVDLFATPGEFEAATLTLHALDDLEDVQVRFDGIPASGEVLPIRTLDKRVTYNADRYIADMPVLAERVESVDVPAGTSKRFVIEMAIDENAAAGTHEGTVTISADGRDPVTIPLRLRVLPYVLAEPSDMFWGEYYRGPQFATTPEGRLAEMRSDLEDQRAHGMTSVGLTFGLPAEAINWREDGSVDIALDGTQYAAFMDMYVELGFPMPVILLSDSGQAAASRAGDFAFESEEWAKAYTTFWRTMQAEHQERGWPEVIVQPVDEPGWQTVVHQQRNVRLLKLLKQIPGMRTEQDGPGDEYFHEVAGPWADVWNYNGGVAEPEVVEQAQAAGHIVTVYNCDVESYRPEVDRYVTGWYQLAADISGAYNWAYVSYNGSPYDDNDHPTGTWMHVYPAIDGEAGGPSTGWIAAREGIDDYRYVHTLLTAIERAEQAGGEAAEVAREARAELDAIIASINYTPRVRNLARWTESGQMADGTRTIGGTLKLPNGWQHADYAANRWLVAQQTLRVLEALGEIEAQ